MYIRYVDGERERERERDVYDYCYCYCILCVYTYGVHWCAYGAFVSVYIYIIQTHTEVTEVAGIPWDGTGYVERLQKVEDQIGKTGAFITGPEFSVADSSFQVSKAGCFFLF